MHDVGTARLPVQLRTCVPHPRISCPGPGPLLQALAKPLHVSFTGFSLNDVLRERGAPHASGGCFFWGVLTCIGHPTNLCLAAGELLWFGWRDRHRGCVADRMGRQVRRLAERYSGQVGRMSCTYSTALCGCGMHVVVWGDRMVAWVLCSGS